MPEFESGTFAVGMIFPYQNPVPSDRKLETWLDSKDFEILDEDAKRSVSISPQGMKVEGEEGIARKDDIRILYNPDANINGFPTSSFITSKNVEMVEFQPAINNLQQIYEWVDSETGAGNDIATFEVTIQGLFRADRNADLSNLYNDDTFDRLRNIGGSDARGLTARFESTAPLDSTDYYRILIDKDAAGNPNLWGLQVVRRYATLDSVEKESLYGTIDELIEHAQG